jgi:hypothetical protein
MAEKENLDLELDDIIREFGSDWINEELQKAEKSAEETFTPHAEVLPEEEETPDTEESPAEEPAEETPEVAEALPEAEEEPSEAPEADTPAQEESSAEPEDALPEAEADSTEIPAQAEDTGDLTGSEEPQVPEAPAETESAEVIPAEAEELPAVSDADTIRLDTLSPEMPAPADNETPVPMDETRVLPELPPEEAPAAAPVDRSAEPPARPIVFRSKLGELKHKLVSGPEKRYYDLSEIGLGRVQAAIFLCLVIVILCAGGTTLYAMDMVAANRLRLMVFSQILGMMLSALLGCYVLMDGILDLFTGKFSLNTMLFLTLAACSADAVFCLQELRVPCCAAFALEMTFALWNRSLRRGTEMGQMDTLRKASRLDGVVKVPDHMGNGPAILRTEGRVEDFMDNYSIRSTPEKALNIYALVSILACIGIAVLAGTRHGLSLAIRVFSTSMLVAVPASAFISQSRPAAILERRLHMVGTVLCGWQGIRSLCGKASIPLFDRDIFPIGSIRLNGVKLLGSHEPEEVISYAAALLNERGGGLEPVFTQLLKSRGGTRYHVDDLQIYTGGLGGVIRGDICLLGLSDFLEKQGIEIPGSARIPNAVYLAVDGTLAAVFVLNYNRTKASAGGLVSMNGCRKLRPMILCRNFTVTPQLIKEKFGIKPKRYDFPDQEVRDEYARYVPNPEITAGALTSQQNLASMAYAVTGARALRGACRAGLWLHLFGGILGLLTMAALAYIGDMHLLSPLNILLYQAAWILPGLLASEWARTV